MLVRKMKQICVSYVSIKQIMYTCILVSKISVQLWLNGLGKLQQSTYWPELEMDQFLEI